MQFPPLDADVATNGEFMEEFHNAMDDMMDNYAITDIFIYGGGESAAEIWFNIVRANTDQIAPGAAEFTTAMVVAWFEAANQYEESRKASAQVQLENAEVDQASIDAIINDPIALRKYIATMRQELIVRLSEIHSKMLVNDPLDLPTKKEVALFEFHKHWYENQGVNDDEYLPNDGAVHYPMLIMEIMLQIKAAGAGAASEIWECFEYMIKVMHNMMSTQSSRDGWEQLKSMPDFSMHEVEIGSLIRQYTSDTGRCIETSDKLSSPFGRGPLRIMRIAQCLMSLPGPFSVINAPIEEQITSLMQLYKQEIEIKELSKTAKFIKEGAEDFFVSFTVAWLLVLDRRSLMYCVTGRNDQSVPKILADMTSMDMSAFADLPARTWSLDHDICGRSEEKPSIEERMFRRRDVMPDKPDTKPPPQQPKSTKDPEPQQDNSDPSPNVKDIAEQVLKGQTAAGMLKEPKTLKPPPARIGKPVSPSRRSGVISRSNKKV
jgi:hypothetical protein